MSKGLVFFDFLKSILALPTKFSIAVHYELTSILTEFHVCNLTRIFFTEKCSCISIFKIFFFPIHTNIDVIKGNKTNKLLTI